MNEKNGHSYNELNVSEIDVGKILTNHRRG